jgi:hypothetical protein
MKTILATLLALACCGCTGFGGKRTILFKLAVPTVFNLELSTTVDGTYKDVPAPASATGDSDVVMDAPVWVPSVPTPPSEPQPPAEPTRPAQPGE